MQGKSNRFRSCNTQRRNIRKDIPIVQGQQCTHSPKSAMECYGFLQKQSECKRGWEVSGHTHNGQMFPKQSECKRGWEEDPENAKCQVVPTKKDTKKFESMLKKTSYGEFKKNAEISKEWIAGVEKIGRIQKPRLFYYFDLLGHRWRERLFHIGDKLYCSIESDGEVSVSGFALEMKASEFYKIIEESEEK